MNNIYRQYSNNPDFIYVEGRTVKECLSHFAFKCPEMEKFIFTQKGELNPILDIYVNAENTYPDELTKTVKDGDEIHIMLLLSGG